VTRRQRGWAYAGVVAAVLAAWPLQKLSLALAQRSIEKSAPAPVATIDEPAPGAGVGAEVTVEGTAVHETIRGWLWLLSSAGGREWKPEGPIATGSGAWQRKILLDGRKGMHVRLAVIAAGAPLNDQLKQRVYELEHPPNRRLYDAYEEQGGAVGRAWRRRLDWEQAPLGDGKTYPPLPAGAALVTSADVTITRPNSMMEVPLPSMGKR
jgi:hypothetical protein